MRLLRIMENLLSFMFLIDMVRFVILETQVS